MTSFTEILNAEKPKNNWTNKAFIQFHYHNVNGANQKRVAMCKTISDYTDAGIVPSGFDVAYGTLSTFQIDQMQRLASKGRVNAIEAEVCVKSMLEDVEKGYNRLAEKLLEDDS